MIAAEKGRMAIVKLLMEKGVESDSEPTEELIRQQVMLPTKRSLSQD